MPTLTAPRLELLRRIAWACAVLMLAITSLSAFIRLSRAGLGCEPWPQCHAQRLEMAPAMVAALDSPGVLNARMAHRVVASTALLLVIGLVLLAYLRSPPLVTQGRLALGLLALALFLAVLGRMAGDSRSPPVVMGNLLAGFSMFALACRLALSCRPAAREPLRWPVRAIALAGLALLVLQAGLGGSLSASHAASRCAESLLCDAHRVSGVLTAGTLAAAGALAWRDGGFAARAVVALAVAEGALGMAMLNAGVPLALALAHNVIAALLAAALLALLPSPER